MNMIDAVDVVNNVASMLVVDGLLSAVNYDFYASVYFKKEDGIFYRTVYFRQYDYEPTVHFVENKDIKVDKSNPFKNGINTMFNRMVK